MSPIKVGVVGYGNSAKRFHLPFIRAIPDYEVVAILQRAEAPSDPSSAPKGSHCTVDWPNVKHYRTAEDFFGDKDIQFVVVATKDDTHASFAEQALLAGKHGMKDSDHYRVPCANREGSSGR
jgi:predicted dehydrogenase